MATETERFFFLPEQKLLPGIMAGMASETISLGNRLVNTFYRQSNSTGRILSVFLLTVHFRLINRTACSLVVTVQAEHLRGLVEQCRVITGMNRMAGRTLFLHIGLVCTLLILPGLIMAGQAEGIGAAPGYNCLPLNTVTGTALSLSHRGMDILFKQHRPITGMGRMTLQAATLNRVVVMGPDKRFILNLMAGTAQGIRGLGQQRDILG